MRAVITIDVPDEFLQHRADEHNAECEPGEERTTPQRYFENVVREMVVDDSLPLTLYTWPIQTTLEVRASG